MHRSRTKWRSESGNSVIEFVFIFCLGATAILTMSLNVETALRDHFAALSIANETLRTWQLTESEIFAKRAAESVARTFLLDPSLVNVTLESSCSIRVVVRGSIETARANC